MNARFALRTQRDKSNGAIYLELFDSRFKDRKFRYATKLYVDPKFCQWAKDSNAMTNRVFTKIKVSKNLTPAENQRLNNINEMLKMIRTKAEEFETMKLNSSTWDTKELKDFLDSIKQDDRKQAEQAIKEQADKLQKEVDFFKIWEKAIDNARNKDGEKISPGTKRSKVQSKVKVSEFCTAKNIKPTLLNIDMDFYYDFDEYMSDLKPNTRGRHMKELKWFLREAAEKHEVNTAYTKKKFKVIRKEVDNIFLNEEQLQKLLDLKLSPAMTRHRDIFVAACYVGARHSDWHQINSDNIHKIDGEDYFKIFDKKTQTTRHIPVPPIVRQLLNKYKGNFGKIISSQKFNDALKTIADKAGLKDVKTHTARRSMATNCYLDDMDVHQIMKFTGHKSESSFLRYLKLNGLDYAKKASKHKFFKKAKMKIA